MAELQMVRSSVNINVVVADIIQHHPTTPQNHAPRHDTVDRMAMVRAVQCPHTFASDGLRYHPSVGPVRCCSGIVVIVVSAGDASCCCCDWILANCSDMCMHRAT